MAQEDWTAVARTINERMTDLGLTQRELVQRSHVSKAIVREIQHNTAQRRRSDRTLEALSKALELHPGHLAAVLAGRSTPTPGEPLVRSDDDVPARLALIEHQLREITDRLHDVAEIRQRLDEISSDLATVLNRAEKHGRK